MNDLFENVERIEYTISESGFKVPHSDWDRVESYYEKHASRDYSGEEYAEMCRFKDKSVARFDKRWKSAQAVIDLVAYELGIEPDIALYGIIQQSNGDFSSPLIEAMRQWFDKSGDKVKLKKRIRELEAQVDALRAVLRGGE